MEKEEPTARKEILRITEITRGIYECRAHDQTVLLTGNDLVRALMLIGGAIEATEADVVWHQC